VAPVFGDPIAAGFVESLARPGGNITGFMSTEYSMAAKWLELLKETAPSVTRVAILRDASQGSGTSQFAAIATIAPALNVNVNPINMGDADQITQSIESFARAPNGGLIVTASGASLRHRDLIVKLAARYKLPTVYYERVFVTAGGLIAYGADFVDQYRRAARLR
jgi:putative ABC transport system substrate-binding protein